MNLLGFPADLAASMAAVVVVYLTLAHAPLLLALLFAFKPQRLQRPWLFALVCCALSYGLLVLAFTLLAVPLGALSIFVLPMWNFAGYYEQFPPLAWFAQGLEVISRWWWLGWPIPCAMVGWWVASRLARVWNNVVTAARRLPSSIT